MNAKKHENRKMLKMRHALVAAVLMAASVCAAGEISIYKDKNGPVTITNMPFPDGHDQKAAAVIEYEELTDQERLQIEEEKKAQAKAWRERQAREEKEWKARMEAERKAEEEQAGAEELRRLKKEVAEAKAAAAAAAVKASALEDAVMAEAYRRTGVPHKGRLQHKQIRKQTKKNRVTGIRPQRAPGPSAPGNGTGRRTPDTDRKRQGIIPPPR